SVKSSDFANVDLGTCSELGFDAIIQALLKSQAPHVIIASRAVKPVHHQTILDTFAI
ncbi:hypothetical protein B0H19DRAFT_1151070, partial [Mycena capillaripes]